MPNFVSTTLEKLQHPPPLKPQHSPHPHTLPTYGKQQQFTPGPDTSPLLSSSQTTYIQSIVGSFLYYGRAVDPTILPAINEIGLSQATPTQNTLLKCKQLLDYLHTHPNATIRYKASDMCLHVDTDAAYLVAPGAKSRIAGYYYLGNKYTVANNTIHPKPTLNGPLHVECKLLQYVVSSAAEAETGGIFANCNSIIPIRNMLKVLGHHQPPTPIKTDNATASSFINKTLKLKRSKSWDMRYFWLLDRISQQQFYIYWDKGTNNHADYWTKHFAPSHHQKIRNTYILKGYHLVVLPTRVC